MLPAGHSGNQAAHLVAIQSHFFRETFPYAQVIAERRNIAALQANLVVFTLNSALISRLGVTTNAANVLMPMQGEHLWKRRERETRRILEALPEAISRIGFVGDRDTGGRVVRTIVGESSRHEWLRCIIKFVPARSSRSGADEAWLLTAYFLDQSEIRRLLRRHEIRPIFHDA